MKKIASLEVFQTVDSLSDQYNDNYQVVMTIPVETSFGSQDIKVSHSVTYSEPAKSSAGQRDRFIRVIKDATNECLKRFKVSITDKG